MLSDSVELSVKGKRVKFDLQKSGEEHIQTNDWSAPIVDEKSAAEPK